MKSYLILLLLWLLFYIPHSILALESIKTKLSQQFPFLKRYYRILYNAQSLLLFAIAFLYQRQLQSLLLFQVNSFFYAIAIVLMLLSFLIIALSFRHYDKYEFLGLQQYQLATFNAAIGSTLNSKGLNQYVRHPLYSATFMFLFGYLLYKPFDTTLIFVLISVAYLIIGTYLEEAKLSKQFGEAYKLYKQKVPMFIPFI
jgi:protein-S-isoprenylcysteine O-methyltransferase Ste14